MSALADKSTRTTIMLLAGFACSAFVPNGAARGDPPTLRPDEVPPAAARAEAASIVLVERITPPVVCIFDEQLRSGGSGVLLDSRGYGLTNYHVVAEMLESRRGRGGLSDGRLYDLQVLGIDPGGDLAMFRLTGREDFPAAILGDSAAVRVGDTVYAVGNPFMLADDYTPSVSRGIVSGVHRYQWGTDGDTLLYSDCLQVDAALNPGNSGGPLFDTAGQVIGINGRISVSMRGRVNVGLGYAITTGQIKSFRPALQAGLLARHGTFDAVVRDAADGAVVFAEMSSSSPAQRAGIVPGDALLACNGRAIRSANDYASLLGTLPADWPVPVTWRQADGTVRHDILRTVAGPAGETDKCVPDPAVNAEAAARVLADHRAALARLANAPSSVPADAGAAGLDLLAVWRVAPGSARDAAGGEYERCAGLPPEWAGVVRGALADLPGVLRDEGAHLQHLGSQRLLRIDAAGHIEDSIVLESLGLARKDAADLRLGFAADSALLRRVTIIDRATQDALELEFATHWPHVGGGLRIACPTGHYLLTAGDEQPADSARRPAPVPADGVASLPAEQNDVLAAAGPRVVRLIGARVGRAEGYGCGVIISSNGLVLTIDAALLDAESAQAILADGQARRLARVYSDRRTQLALVRLVPPDEAATAEPAPVVPVADYPHYSLAEPPAPQIGQWLWAVGNPFKVAAGSEALSAVRGVCAGTIELDATRGTQDFPYHGPVLLVDAITSTPGFAGGAVVDRAGRLVGLIGRAAESRVTRTQVNYAIPAATLRAFLAAAAATAESVAGTTPAAASQPPESPATQPAGYHGLRFFQTGHASSPVYVESVKRGSPAARAGVRKGDLILSANDRPVPRLDALQAVLDQCHAGDTLRLTVLRGEQAEVLSVLLEAGP